MSKNKYEKGSLYKPKYVIPTPSLQVNQYLTEGGIPSGSIAQLQSSGEATFKTSMAISMLGEAQQQGLEVGYVDAEGAITDASRPWLRNLGLDVDECYFMPPMAGEEIYEEIFYWIKEVGVKVIVLDSIHSCQPSKLYDGSVGDHHIGNHATMHKQGLLKLKQLVQPHDVLFIAINHKKVNLTSQGAFGTKATGGSAWGFYSEYIFVNSRSSARSKIGGEDLIELDIFIEKNKGGTSFHTITTYARQGYGIDEGAEIMRLALSEGILEKKGSWYRMDGDPVAQGSDSTIQWVNENKEMLKEKLHDTK